MAASQEYVQALARAEGDGFDCAVSGIPRDENLYAETSGELLAGEHPPAWWKPRGEELSIAARYPATDSVSEWADEILALDHLLNEGFLPKPLMKLAEALGRPVDKQWKSLRLLQDYLESKGRPPISAPNSIDTSRAGSMWLSGASCTAYRIGT